MVSNTSENPVHNTVAIIIPIYNRRKTLGRLFTSLSRIHYRPLEIILIDNVSEDDSFLLCQNFQKELQGSGIEIKLGQVSRRGACACRNQGIELADSEFLYFFDSDDEISGAFFDALMPFVAHYDLVAAPTQMVLEDGTLRKRDCIPTSYPYDHILSASLSTQSFIVRKSFLKKVGNWDEQLLRWNDWELGVRLLCHSPRLKWLPSLPFHKIYQHPESISGSSFKKDYPILQQSLEKAHQDLLQSTLPSRIKIPSLNALAAKYMLLAAHLYREGDKCTAQLCKQRALQLMQTPLFRHCSSLIFFLSKHHVPGTWRMYRWVAKADRCR